MLCHKQRNHPHEPFTEDHAEENAVPGGLDGRRVTLVLVFGEGLVDGFGGVCGESVDLVGEHDCVVHCCYGTCWEMDRERME